MGAGGASSGTAGSLDVGALGSPEDNTFDRSTTVAGTSSSSPPSFWSGWWSWTAPSDGWLLLDTNATEGAGLLDTTLWLYGDFGGLFPVGSDDDSGDGRLSKLGVTVEAGFTYYVKVGSFDDDGDGITIYHVAAQFNPIPVLPNPRTYRIPGGSLTTPGLVMGPGVVDAPSMPPLSISTPTDGTQPDATYVFDATTWLASIGVDSAWLELDSTLSYLTDGQWDEFAPEVGLNVFHVDHAMPFTYEEDWATDFIGVDTGTDDYGRPVPRGQSFQFVETGKTYIIQLTTPPGNDVRFILRVSALGAATDWIQPADNTIITAKPAGIDGDLTGVTPSSYFDAAGTEHTDGLPAGDAGTSIATMDGNYVLDHGLGSTHYPGVEQDALDCAWEHAIRGAWGTKYWTSDGTATGIGTPSCIYDFRFNAGDILPNTPVGYTFVNSQATIGDHQTIEYHSFNTTQRVNLTELLAAIGREAGVDPVDIETPPTGFPTVQAVFYEADSDALPEVVKLEASPSETDDAHKDYTVVSGSVVGNKQVPRWSAKVVGPAGGDDARNEWNGWGPKEFDLSAVADRWEGSTSLDGNPDAFIALQDVQLDAPAYQESGGTDYPLPEWTELDGTLVDLTLDYEATWAAGGTGDDDYKGGLRFTAMGDGQQIGTTRSDPDSGGTLTDSNLTDHQIVLLRLTLRPGRVRFVALPEIPAVILSGGFQPPLRLTRRNDRYGPATSGVNSGFYRQGGNRLTGAL